MNSSDRGRPHGRFRGLNVAVLPPPPGEPAKDPWAFPDVVVFDASRVRYPRPRSYYEGTQLKQAGEAVELLVRTSAELPVLLCRRSCTSEKRSSPATSRLARISTASSP